MPNQAQLRSVDSYGHTQDIQTCYGSGFTAAASGTAAGTVVNPGTADPTGTTNLTIPFGANDSQGLISITTAGTQTTGALRTIYFSNAYAFVPTGVSVTISTTAGAAAGGTITTTITNSSLAISIGTALTTATTYYIRYTIAG
jgi:hypothetical protein